MKKLITLFALTFCLNLTSQVSSSGITGSGTTNYIPKFSASKKILNSNIYSSSGFVGIGTSSPSSLSPILELKSTNSIMFQHFTGTSISRGFFINSDSDNFTDGFFKVSANSGSYGGNFFEPSGRSAIMRVAVNDGATSMPCYIFTANGKIYLSSNASFTGNVPNNPGITIDNGSIGIGTNTPNTKFEISGLSLVKPVKVGAVWDSLGYLKIVH